MSSIASGTTTTTGLVYTSDTTGNLVLQTNGTTTAVTIDTSQNVGVGVTPSAWNSSVKVIEMSNGRNGALFADSGYYGAFGLSENAVWTPSSTNWTYKTTNASVRYDQNGVAGAGTHAWFIAPSGTAGTTISWTQAMTLDISGNLLIGTTTLGTTNAYFQNSTNARTVLSIGSNTTSSVGLIYFNNSNGGVGTISTSGTATAYNTTSDRRLKTNIVDLTNSGTVIDSLKPRSFTWISDSSADAGFIADEIQQVLPKAVTGQPNATKEEEYEVTPAVKDSEGNITTPAVMGTRTVPDYQMIDASQPELIAYLVAEVQSLRARLKAANIA
jgi:hypothetical protein